MANSNWDLDTIAAVAAAVVAAAAAVAHVDNRGTSSMRVSEFNQHFNS